MQLALRSIRYRAGGFAASLLTLLLGAIILMTFASLLDTATATDPPTAESLTIMANVVGGWGLVIVTFAAASTLTLLARQRGTEMTLLRTIGATPAQIRRLLLAEAVLLAVVAVAAAVVPSVFTGRMLVGLLADARRIPPGVTPEFGPIAVSVGLGVTLAAAAFAALLAARRVTKTSLTSGKSTRGRVAVIAGVVALAAGIGCAVTTVVALESSDLAVMAVSAQACILCAVGFALLGPSVITAAARVLTSLRRGGTHLTVSNLRGHTQQMATALAPIVLFTAIATGTLYMQSIENNSAIRPPAEIAGTIETLNYVVVAMITLFAAVMLINTTVAATLHRRREFGQLRLAGSTRPQVVGMVGAEAAVLAAVGVLLGTLAATATVIPYSIVKTDSVLPDATITTYLGVVLAAAVLTLATSLTSARRATRHPAITAVSATL
ncbi:FtsX-like permease family protein [Kibdelosporangium phytohabitans]|uniref:FtsX-like permease family protein n=1 Tax=Kibdelosporangium phytohabitans TaxID=860235 RepID=UPI001A0ED8BA|nr:FtsX-like permease family protein [Kibdelosporangium phytohabitans]MBE1461038.1 putative ABC transport system permease protein [Kibdelosporangium phytohabitans]